MKNELAHITVGRIWAVVSYHSSQAKISVCGDSLVVCGSYQIQCLVFVAEWRLHSRLPELSLRYSFLLGQ